MPQEKTVKKVVGHGILKTIKNSRGTETVFLNCMFCGKEYSKSKYKYLLSKKNFCSNFCRIEYFKSLKITKKCIVCEKLFITKKSHYNKRKTCSMRCLGIFYEKELVGKNNPNWKKGKFPYPNNGELQKNRKQVLVKNNHKCYLCKKTATHIHHQDFSKTNHHIDNLKPICNSCHIRVHSIERGKKQIIYKNYGMRMVDIQKIIKLDLSYLYDLHHSGKLKKMLCVND